MSDVFFTSDLHIGHAQVAGWRGYKDIDRPQGFLKGVEQHDAILAFRWDTAVKPDDVVWVLGDISAGGRAAQMNALQWIKQRPGVKHLIAGNHDGCHPMHRDSHKWQRVYLEVFESVQMAAKRRIPLPDGHTSALLSHFPYNSDHTSSSRYMEWRLRDEGYWLLHGHTHDDSVLNPHNPREIHVGVDAWGLAPVHWDQICEIVREQIG